MALTSYGAQTLHEGRSESVAIRIQVRGNDRDGTELGANRSLAPITLSHEANFIPWPLFCGAAPEPDNYYPRLRAACSRSLVVSRYIEVCYSFNGNAQSWWLGWYRRRGQHAHATPRAPSASVGMAEVDKLFQCADQVAEGKTWRASGSNSPSR